jgi:hypothetical protein
MCLYWGGGAIVGMCIYSNVYTFKHGLLTGVLVKIMLLMLLYFSKLSVKIVQVKGPWGCPARVCVHINVSVCVWFSDNVRAHPHVLNAVF